MKNKIKEINKISDPMLNIVDELKELTTTIENGVEGAEYNFLNKAANVSVTLQRILTKYDMLPNLIKARCSVIVEEEYQKVPGVFGEIRKEIIEGMDSRDLAPVLGKFEILDFKESKDNEGRWNIDLQIELRDGETHSFDIKDRDREMALYNLVDEISIKLYAIDCGNNLKIAYEGL